MMASTQRRLRVGLIFCVGLIALAVSVGGSPRIVRQSFPLEGINKVVVRADRIHAATVDAVKTGDTLVISGTCTGGASGYHSPEPTWRETSANRWGLGFVAKRYGDVLVVSSFNEIRYIHHAYYFRNIKISLPANVTLVKQARELNGDGAPDLRKP